MRGFDDAERARIREALVEAGQEFFLQYGPERTTVEDLTDEVGIAKGSFYTFFDSKSALFMEVFRRLGKAQVETVLGAVEDIDAGEEGIRVLFHTYIEWLEEHPVIQKLSRDVDSTRFRRSLPPDEWARAERIRDERLATAVERWQDNGTIRDDVPAEDVIGLLEPLAVMAVTTRDYDEAYRTRRDLSIETLARGVVPADGA
jgi:TetR/AcrR family transcriptional regulator